MYILGLSAFYHDSAAALIQDGRVIAAAEEERFDRVKHSAQFPSHAVKFCLEQAEITMKDVQYVAYYEKPLLRFERVIESIVRGYPNSLGLFLKGVPEWLGEKIKVENHIRKDLKYTGKILFIPHHLSHAAASYYSSDFHKAAILTIDGIGEYQTTGLWQGLGNVIIPLKQIDYPHSLGLLYSTVTAFLGFRVNEDEYKVMGLSAYGKPMYVKQMRELIDIKEDGSFHLDMRYFAFHKKFKMWSRRFEKLLGPPRQSNEVIASRHKDIASSLQSITEEIYFKILRHLHTLTKTSNLVLGGGVALNALANGKIYKKTPFKNVYILGPAGDGGNALGAAYSAYYQILKKKTRRQRLDTLYLGTQYDNAVVKSVIQKHRVSYIQYSRKGLIRKAALLLSQGKVLGWFQGGMEYGPRALGARSILADPQKPAAKIKVNKIKIRKQFQPFAGSILQEKVHEYFEVPQKYHWSPFMLFCFQVKKEAQKHIEAIVHKDGTCRIQTVSPANGIYYDLIKQFYQITGRACILNTSFNLKGEPIVETPDQALQDFLKTKMDYLIIENFIVSKKSMV